MLERWKVRMKIIKGLKILLGKLIPKVHNLPQVIYINWFGYEWFIKKSDIN